MRTRPLTTRRVFEAAIEVADDGGVAAITMRRVADALGVEAMSLYHHVANKDQILDGVVDAIIGKIELPIASDDWQAGIRRRAASARTVLARHPWALGLMESRANAGPATLAHHDAVLRNLRAAGFSVAMAAHVFALVDSYVYGFVLQEANLPFDTPEELEHVAEDLASEEVLAAYPHLGEMITDHALQPGYSFAAEFEFGLSLIIDGLDTARRQQS